MIASMSDAYVIGMFILAGLAFALRWIAEDWFMRADRQTLIGVAVLVGMVALGIAIVATLRGSAAG